MMFRLRITRRMRPAPPARFCLRIAVASSHRSARSLLTGVTGTRRFSELGLGTSLWPRSRDVGPGLGREAVAFYAMECSRIFAVMRSALAEAMKEWMQWSQPLSVDTATWSIPLTIGSSAPGAITAFSRDQTASWVSGAWAKARQKSLMRSVPQVVRTSS